MRDETEREERREEGGWGGRVEVYPFISFSHIVRVALFHLPYPPRPPPRLPFPKKIFPRLADPVYGGVIEKKKKKKNSLFSLVMKVN